MAFQGRRSPRQPPVFTAASLKIAADNLPPGFDKADVYGYFSQFGSVSYIKLEQSNRAIVTFVPSPLHTNKFLNVAHRVSKNDVQARLLGIRSLSNQQNRPIFPGDTRQSLPGRVALRASHLTVGAETGESEMVALRNIEQNARHPDSYIQIAVNTFDNNPTLTVDFPIVFQSIQLIPHQLNIRLAYISKVQIAPVEDHWQTLIFTFRYPPKFFSFDPNHALPYDDGQDQWSRQNGFCRITDIDLDMQQRHTTPVSLCRTGALIDLGRWLTYSVKIPEGSSRDVTQLEAVLHAYNVPIIRAPHSMNTIVGQMTWQLFDTDSHIKSVQRGSGNAVAYLTEQTTGFPVLNFEVRYRVEVCLSKGLLYEGCITEAFLHQLASLGTLTAMNILDNLIASDRKHYDPMDLLNMPELKARRKRRVPKTCVPMHSVNVTPTTIYVNPVQTEVSNRVIRKYSDIADRFLRVRFTDEVYFGQLFKQQDGGKDDDVYERVRRVLINGIRVAGRLYVFLACGNSQFRENGAYFFSPTQTTNVNSIRQWMGYFHQIREIPKYISRVGQCFSTTRAVTSIGQQPEIVRIKDVKRNGYIFTDGVGKISPFLAQMISQELRLGVDAPSLYQFRMGGCKGVLVVDPTLVGKAVCIRPSQEKFISTFNQLEIIRVSSFASAYLNIQIILVLSTLGIPEEVFLTKMRKQLASLNKCLEDDTTAINMLQHNIDANQVTSAISRMISGGMRHDPFVDSLLHLWRAWMVKWLKEKANLFIPDGAFLLGGVDETNTLRMDEGQLPEIFLQVPDDKGGYKVVQEVCILVRNPALHPGDIRVVRAVDCPGLRHAKDVVILPQRGKRDLANMCSGGDLDGDDFLVMWDPDLIPKDHFQDPMCYKAPEPILSHGPVTQSDMIYFICEYMKNNSLGSIAVAHRVWADLFDAGVKHDKCIQLAQLHSMAVDYPKTGVPARMSADLRVKGYPHWHGGGKKKFSYKSKKVLGQLYDAVEHVDFKPRLVSAGNFDPRIINSKLAPPPDVLAKAVELKAEFDEDMRRLMAQFGVQTEFEIWSTFVLEHNRDIRDYKFAEELGRLMTALRHHYHDACIEAIGTTQGMADKDDKLASFVAALYKISAEQVAEYKSDEGWHKAEGYLAPLISFPWIFQDELLALAVMGEPGNENVPLTEAMTRCNVTAARARKGMVNGGSSRFDSLRPEDLHVTTTSTEKAEADPTLPALDTSSSKATKGSDSSGHSVASLTSGDASPAKLGTGSTRATSPASSASSLGTAVEAKVGLAGGGTSMLGRGRPMSNARDQRGPGENTNGESGGGNATAGAKGTVEGGAAVNGVDSDEEYEDVLELAALAAQGKSDMDKLAAMMGELE